MSNGSINTFTFLTKHIYIIWGELVHGSGFQGLKMFPQNEKLVFPLKKSFAENKWPLDKTSWKLFLKTVCDIHWRGSELLSQQRFDLTSSNFMYWCNTLPWVVAFAPIPPPPQKKDENNYWPLEGAAKSKKHIFFPFPIMVTDTLLTGSHQFPWWLCVPRRTAIMKTPCTKKNNSNKQEQKNLGTLFS